MSTDFDYVARLVKEKSGITLTPDKEYLLELRLRPVAQALGLTGCADLIARLRGTGGGMFATPVVEAMTTNETSFFRDGRPFDLLRDEILPRLQKARSPGRPLRIWCAATSSGQEPYSLAMLLAEEDARGRPYRTEIVATDLASHVLARAKAGLYSQFEVQRGLSDKLLAKYFERSGAEWQLRPAIRQTVTFRTQNLLSDMTALGTFDIVLCRNVLIYFDQPTKARVLEAIGRQMPADGVLMLGGAETVLGISDRFQPLPGHRGAFGKAVAVAKPVPAPVLAPRPLTTAA